MTGLGLGWSWVEAYQYKVESSAQNLNIVFIMKVLFWFNNIVFRYYLS
jgi:hypothetical protein